METQQLETERLLLRTFTESDMGALYSLLGDEEVNTFLPWFPVRSLEETRQFYQDRFCRNDGSYNYAICRKEENIPIGYIKADAGDSYDFGYALRKEFWHRGIVTEAGRTLLEQLKKDGIPYITATHDVKNPRSGGVMRKLGMKYQYSYEELWQPKNFPVIFRMYQLNFDGNDDRVYRKYWNQYESHFIETGLSC